MSNFMRVIVYCVILLTANESRADIECGSTLASAGTTYTLTANKTCDGAFVTIGADNVVVEGGGFTITYGNTVSSHGIISSGYSGVKIHNLVMTQGAYGMNGVYSLGNHATDAGTGLSGAEIYGNTFNISTTNDTAGIKVTYNKITGVTIHDNIFNINKDPSSYGIYLSGRTTQDSNIVVENNNFNMGSAINSEARPAAIRLIGFPGNPNDRPKFRNNNITISGCGTAGYLAWGTNYWDVTSNTVVLDSTSCGSKGLQLDGQSDFNTMSNNSVTISNIDTVKNRSSYAIRVRYGSSDNDIFDNTIDASASTVKSYGYSLGQIDSDINAPQKPPTNNKFYNNTVVTAGSGNGLHLYVDTESSYIYCNNFTNLTGPTVGTLETSGTTSNLYMSSNSHVVGASVPAIRISSLITGITNWPLCSEIVNGSPMTSADISDPGNIGGWTVTSSNCENICSSGGRATSTYSGAMSIQ